MDHSPTAAQPPAAPIFETLTATLDGRLGRLTLDQPDKLNPIGTRTLKELIAAARWFDQTDASIVIVSGSGRAFSAGFDLRELGSDDPEVARSPELGAAMSAAIGEMEAVTIAAVHGPCVGGGFVLALSCDLRVAADDAWFSLPEAALGIPLAWSGVPRLVREVGAARTIDLVLTCRRVPATEADAMGLLNQVVSADELTATADALAALLLERRPAVVATTKRQAQAAAEELVASTGDAAGTDLLLEALRSLRSELEA